MIKVKMIAPGMISYVSKPTKDRGLDAVGGFRLSTSPRGKLGKGEEGGGETCHKFYDHPVPQRARPRSVWLSGLFMR